MNATRTNTQSNVRANTAVDLAVKSGMVAMTSSAAFIGLWSVACFASALLSSGPAALLTGWFAAVVGI